MEHIAAGIVGKGEAVAGVSPGLVGLDGILQSAGLPDDGHGAVAHGDHLAEAAGLTLGRHQEQIGAGVDGHGQALVVIQPDGHAAVILLGGPVEELLVLLITLAQHHQLQREFHHIMKNLTNQVQTLVGHQSGHNAHDGHVGVLPQPHELLQLRLVHGLAGHVRHGEAGGDVFVIGGVVALHVDAVEHTGELIAALAHDAVQPVGEIGHFQLIGVGGRHGVHRIGAQNGALEQVYVAVHHDGAVLCPAVVQAEQVAQGTLAVAALVLDVMDGQGSLDGAVLLLPDAVILQVDGHQGGLPVVAVDHIRPEGQVGQHPHHSPGEEAETLAVIRVAVQVGAVEILLIVHKVPGDAVPLQGEQAAVAVAPG